MTPERWQKVDRLLNEALAKPLEERDAFLAAACANDEELLREVESLLSFHGINDGLVERCSPRGSGLGRLDDLNVQPPSALRSILYCRVAGAPHV